MTPPATKLQFFLYGLVGVFVAISLALIGAAGGYYLGQRNNAEPSPNVSSSPTPVQPTIPEGVACPMDAKICPDGSSVGRTGPNCEFAPCPGE